MAVTKYIATARKLQTACNKSFGVKILINTKQWYSKDKDRAVTQYRLIQTIPNEDRAKETNIELFRTYSQIQMVLFLRDYWYKLNGWEVPHDNLEWEEIKARYGGEEKQETGPIIETEGE